MGAIGLIYSFYILILEPPKPLPFKPPNGSVIFLPTDLTFKSKVRSVVVIVTKLLVVAGLLYLFVCSLNFLSNAFRLIAGRTTGMVPWIPYSNKICYEDLIRYELSVYRRSYR